MFDILTCAAVAPGTVARSTLNEYKRYSKKQVQQEAVVEYYKAELERAMSDMQELLASEDCRSLGDSEEVVAGRAVLDEAQAARVLQGTQ